MERAVQNRTALKNLGKALNTGFFIQSFRKGLWSLY